MAISWSLKRQGSTSNSTAEAETVALCYALKHEGLPTLILFDTRLAGAKRPVEIFRKVDNTQAIATVHKGYSPNVLTPLKFVEARKMMSMISTGPVVV